jgi:hypothetical protein
MSRNTTWPDESPLPTVAVVTGAPDAVPDSTVRAVAEVNGRTVDLSEHNVKWQSSHPQLVRVEQTGLVQRVRSTARPVGIRALLADGRVLAETVAPPDINASDLDAP